MFSERLYTFQGFRDGFTALKSSGGIPSSQCTFHPSSALNKA